MTRTMPAVLIGAADPAAPVDLPAGAIASLIRATGPVSYDYQFGPDGTLLRAVADHSWAIDGTLFARDMTMLALVDGQLAGMAMAFPGDDFYRRKAALVASLPPLIAELALDPAELEGLMIRAEQASYLNAHAPSHAWYLLALAVEPTWRGHAVGAALLTDVIARGRAAGFAEVQLDVLADNPAVDFYHAFGFRILAEIRSPELSERAGFPSEYRMGLTL